MWERPASMSSTSPSTMRRLPKRCCRRRDRPGQPRLAGKGGGHGSKSGVAVAAIPGEEFEERVNRAAGSELRPNARWACTTKAPAALPRPPPCQCLPCRCPCRGASAGRRGP
eukprot:3524321-Lingulodinium_polyedra.AAC.1